VEIRAAADHFAATGFGITYMKGINITNIFSKLAVAQTLMLVVCISCFQKARSPLSHKNTPPPQLGYDQESWETAKRRAHESLGQLRTAFLWAFACFSLLYLCFVVRETAYVVKGAKATLILDVVSDVLSVGSNAALLACYIALAERTTDTGESPFRMALPCWRS
jgi:hypothetical protein